MSKQKTKEIVLRGGFESINITHFRKETLRKGEEIQDHLFNVEEIRSEVQVLIKAQILRTVSIREKPYSVEFVFDISRKYINGRCSCVAGITANCKHAAALYYYINNERTVGCTDESQKWRAPSKKMQEQYPKGETIEKIITGSTTPHCSFIPGTV